MKVNVYNNVWQALTHPDDIADLTFTELVLELMDSQQEIVNKEDAMLFNVCSTIKDFEHPPELNKDDEIIDYSPHNRTDLIRRCKANVDTIYCLLLDIDDNKTLDEAITEWVDYEFFIYSSFSHSKAKDKFRLILPLKRPLTAKEFNERHAAMVKKFNYEDGASFTMSQCFYFPSYSKDNKDDAFMYYNESNKRYDALQLSTVTIAEANEKHDIVMPTAMTAMGKSVYNTLITGNNLHLVDAMPLAMLCKSHGIDFAGYCSIVGQTGQNSCVSDKVTNLKELYGKGYNNHMTHKKSLELMQRMGCDTWRFN